MMSWCDRPYQHIDTVKTSNAILGVFTVYSLVIACSSARTDGLRGLTGIASIIDIESGAMLRWEAPTRHEF